MKSKGSLRNLARLGSPTISSGTASKMGGSVGGLGTSARGLSLIRVNVQTEGKRLISLLNELGFKYHADDIARKLDKLSAKILNEMTDNALAAVKSKVPVHYYSGGTSAELRNHHIHATGSPYAGAATPGRFKSGSSAKLSRDVYVDNKAHTVPYRQKRVIASSLADFKDTISEKRTGPSLPESGFKPSASAFSKGWISEAIVEFQSKRKSTISRIVNGKL